VRLSIHATPATRSSFQILLSPIASRQLAVAPKRARQRTRHGGKRAGSDRKKGVPNKLTANVKTAIMTTFADAGEAASGLAGASHENSILTGSLASTICR
jgi:hypothetical protein